MLRPGGTLLNPARYSANNRSHIVFNLQIIESQHRQPFGFQNPRPLGIVAYALGGMMLGTVNFDDQHFFRAVEINDISRNPFLPIELQTMNLLSTDFLPQHIFMRRHIAAQPTGYVLQFIFIHT